jgi:hypothetical protein
MASRETQPSKVTAAPEGVGESLYVEKPAGKKLPEKYMNLTDKCIF